MQKVPRKNAKKEKKMRLWLMLALGLCLLCAGLMLLLGSQEPLPEPQKAEEIWITAYPAEEIQGLLIAPGEGVSYPLIRGESGMQLMGRQEEKLREDVVQEMLEAAGYLQAQHVIGKMEEIDAPLSAFGLDEPELRVVLTLQDGSKQELLFGSSVPQTDLPQYYCLSQNTLYTVLQEPCYALFHDADYLRHFEQPELQSDLIDRIEMTGSKEMILQYTHDGFMMEKPIHYPVNDAKLNALLLSLERMAFEAYLGTPEECDLSEMGLSEPEMTVTLTQAASVITGQTTEGEEVSVEVPETEYTLLLGRETGKSGVYLQWEGKVYRASNFLLGFWKEMQPEEFYSLAPMNIAADKLRELTVTYGGKTTTYQVEMVESLTENNQIATDEYGQTLWDAQVKKEGQLMETGDLFTWYVQLNQMGLSGRVQEGYVPQGEPVASIFLQGSAGERWVRFYSYDALHCVMAVNGTPVHYLERSALQILEALP